MVLLFSSNINKLHYKIEKPSAGGEGGENEEKDFSDYNAKLTIEDFDLLKVLVC